MNAGKARRARIVFLLWLAVTILYFQLATAYVRVARADQEFGEYLQRVVQLVGAQDRTGRELRQLIHGKADELHIPLDPAQVDIRGHGEELELGLSYSVVVEFPLISRPAFHKQFHHDVSFMVPR